MKVSISRKVNLVSYLLTKWLYVLRFPVFTHSLDPSPCHKLVAGDITHYKIINQASVNCFKVKETLYIQWTEVYDRSHDQSYIFWTSRATLCADEYATWNAHVDFTGIIILTFTYLRKQEWAGPLQHLRVHHHHHHHPAQNNFQSQACFWHLKAVISCVCLIVLGGVQVVPP